ncbi:hypothetical protein ACFQJD_11360 [Haloplanus sp. GCM10025708]|uniref:hypothetical protein n=1 Tax=Haloferacaceae TaxID=1644056 RepID=UPI003614058F
MPEIEITPEQRDRLRALQEDLARDVVGKYGHVRPKDAVEYLLDQHDGDDASDAGAGDDEATAAASTADETDEGGKADEGGEAVARVVDDPEADDAATAEPSASADDAITSTGTETETASESAAGDDSMLDAMLSLLNTHDDKWEESSAADERYAVELPDGSTEHVRTKDDVKALLFEHYR